MDRLYGYGIGITAGLATIGYFVAPALDGWLFLLIVLVWAARRHVPNDDRGQTRTNAHTNEYGEVWHGDE